MNLFFFPVMRISGLRTRQNPRGVLAVYGKTFQQFIWCLSPLIFFFVLDCSSLLNFMPMSCQVYEDC